MPGQLINRGENKWLVRIFLGRDQNGKRRYFNHTIHDTKKVAQKYLTAKLRERDLGTFVEPSILRVDEFLDKWLDTAAKPRLSSRTFESYKDLLRLHIRPLVGNIRLSDLRASHLQEIVSTMQLRGLAPRTIRYAHSVLSSALEQAVRWNMVVQNPAKLVELPRQVHKEMRALSPEEAKRFLNAAKEDRLDVLFQFALMTGMRPEEYLALQWKDVDLLKGVAVVQRALIRQKGGGWHFGQTKTARSRRAIPLPASLVKALSKHRKTQAEQRLKAGPAYQCHDLVFATLDGTPFTMRNIIRRHFRPTLKRAGLPESMRLYDLRHSCATLLLASGEHPKVVSERLGHASCRMTLDVYSHVLPTMQEAASERLDRLLYNLK